MLSLIILTGHYRLDSETFEVSIFRRLMLVSYLANIVVIYLLEQSLEFSELIITRSPRSSWQDPVAKRALDTNFQCVELCENYTEDRSARRVCGEFDLIEPNLKTFHIFSEKEGCLLPKLNFESS